jgi:hypothetical protein
MSLPEPAEKPVRSSAAVRKAVRKARQLPGRDGLSDLAAAVVADTLVKVLNGDIVIGNATQARHIVDVAYGVVRLEAGEATSITQMNQGEIMDAIRQLRDKAKAIPTRALPSGDAA